MSLPQKQVKQFLPHLETVDLELKEVLYEPNQPINYIYFPNNGVVSLVTVMEDGSVAEVATVGNEGMVGLPIFLGAETIPREAFAQIPGTAVRMRAGAFKQEAKHNGALTTVLHRYTQALFNQIAQTAACNRLHSIEERAARWMLMTHDRVGSDQFPLTQEFLAYMLGVRRPRVNIVGRMLQEAGMIRYTRGKITILDREGLDFLRVLQNNQSGVRPLDRLEDGFES